MIVSETVQHAMDCEQTQLVDGALRSLRLGALDGDCDVTDMPAAELGILSAWEREHVGRLVAAQEAPVEITQLGIVGEPHGQRGARRHAERVATAAQQRGQPR